MSSSRVSGGARRRTWPGSSGIGISSSIERVNPPIWVSGDISSQQDPALVVLGEDGISATIEEKQKDGDEINDERFSKTSVVSSCPAYSSTNLTVSDLDATVSIKMLANPGFTTDPEMDERKRVLEAFGKSVFSFPHPHCDFPTFFAKEVIEGKILGRGGFSSVAEVTHIQCLRRSKDGKSCVEQTELEGTEEFDTRNKESRAFMAQHCRRAKSGQARYAIKRLLPSIVNDKQLLYAGVGDLVVETRFLYHLEHPNIVKLRGIAAGNPFSKDFFIVLDRLYNTLLVRMHQWAERKRKSRLVFNRLMCGKVRTSCRQLLEEQLTAAYDLSGALEYLHTKKRVCHRDIKVSAWKSLNDAVVSCQSGVLNCLSISSIPSYPARKHRF